MIQTCCVTGIGCSISKKKVALPYAGVSTTIRLAAWNTKTNACSSLRMRVRKRQPKHASVHSQLRCSHDTSSIASGNEVATVVSSAWLLQI